MIDINLIRENPDLVRENIKKKFQDKNFLLLTKYLHSTPKNAPFSGRATRGVQSAIRSPNLSALS